MPKAKPNVKSGFMANLHRHSPLFLSAGAGLLFAFLAYQSAPLSRDSLNGLSTLNAYYDMNTELLPGDDAPSLSGQLHRADILSATGSNAPSKPQDLDRNIGLIAKLENSDFLLLTPNAEYSESELESMAESYLENIPEFTSVEPDQEVLMNGSPVYWTPSLNEDYQEAELSSENETEEGFFPKAKIKIAVVDSGIDLNHEIFKNVQLEQGFNTIDPQTPSLDDVGHGTHVAGIIAMNTSNAVLIPYKIVDAKGGRLSNVLSALNKALDDHVDIINTSFGLLQSSPALESLVDEAYKRDIFIVSAAGNHGSSRGFYPASYPNTIAVAGLNKEGVKMTRSNFGTWVDLAAPGELVLSSLPDGRYGYKSGTSQAAPFVSAHLADILYNSSSTASAEELLDELKKTGKLLEDGVLAGIFALGG